MQKSRLKKAASHKLTKDQHGRINTYYFAYGSNLHLEQMENRCQGSIPQSTAMLKDHKLTYRGASRGYGVANIEPEKGAYVLGAIYSIDERDLAALDRYEGFPTLYYRADIEVEIDGVNGPEMVKAFAYFMHTDEYQPATPAVSYFHTIRTGFQNWGLSTRHLEKQTTAWVDAIEGVRS